MHTHQKIFFKHDRDSFHQTKLFFKTINKRKRRGIEYDQSHALLCDGAHPCRASEYAHRPSESPHTGSGCPAPGSQQSHKFS